MLFTISDLPSPRLALWARFEGMCFKAFSPQELALNLPAGASQFFPVGKEDDYKAPWGTRLGQAGALCRLSRLLWVLPRNLLCWQPTRNGR